MNRPADHGRERPFPRPAVFRGAVGGGVVPPEFSMSPGEQGPRQWLPFPVECLTRV